MGFSPLYSATVCYYTALYLFVFCASSSNRISKKGIIRFPANLPPLLDTAMLNLLENRYLFNVFFIPCLFGRNPLVMHIPWHACLQDWIQNNCLLAENKGQTLRSDLGYWLRLFCFLYKVWLLRHLNSNWLFENSEESMKEHNLNKDCKSNSGNIRAN